jgi:hypothetical protein
VDPPSQVVAGVRTVTTNMNGRGILPRCRACSLFYEPRFSSLPESFLLPVIVLQSAPVSFKPPQFKF